MRGPTPVRSLMLACIVEEDLLHLETEGNIIEGIMIKKYINALSPPVDKAFIDTTS